MKTSKRNRVFIFLLALIMLVGMLPISVLSVDAESGCENAVGADWEAARASTSWYPALTNLVEGTEITYGYVYFFYKNGRVGDRPAVYAIYDKPTSLPNNMKVLSMQWLGPDQKPMRTYDKFEVGKSYFLDLRIGFEGGEEKGYVYPKNYREFKVNGKSVNQWMEYDDNTNGHFLRVYESYKLVDPSAGGTLSGTVKSYNSTTDPVTVQLFKSGSSSAAYSTTVKGNSASYTISGVASGTYTMKVSKKNHVTREYSVTVSTGTKTQNAEIRLLGDVNGDGRVNTMDYTRLLKHVNETQLLTDAYALKCSDVNKDNRVNTMDYTRLLKHVNETQPLW